MIKKTDLSIFIFLLIDLACLSPVYANPIEICDNLYIDSEQISFSTNEKKLICDGKTKGWKSIPLNQKIYQIKIYLQSRGYYRPEVKTDNSKVTIVLNEISRIKNVSFVDEPSGFSKQKYIGSVGKILTAENLNEVKTWAMGRLASIGYPCAEVEGRASFETGEVVVKIIPNSKAYLEQITREGNTRFHSGIFSRFDAFEIGDVYNDDFLALTTQRVINSGLVSYSYFENTCEKSNTLNQKFLSNKPNTMIFGVGGSSEEMPILEFKWKNTGLDKKGSELIASLYGSNRKQELELGFNYYPLRHTPRFSIRPSFNFTKEIEQIYEAEERKIEIGFIQTRDTSTLKRVIEIVPAKSTETNFDSDLPAKLEVNQIRFSMGSISHYYEYYRNSPRRGFQLNLDVTPYSAKTDEFEETGTALNFSGTFLTNKDNLHPPKLILGTRFFFKNVSTDVIGTIPQSFRLYLGGQDDIRGFARKSINNDEIGFKSSANLSIEARLTSVLPYRLQPYFFYDFAKAGIEAWIFTEELYHSPGVGLRFESPFGNFRFNIANGLIANNTTEVKEGWNFFFSYGREF